MEMAPFQILNSGILLNRHVLQIVHLRGMMLLQLTRTTAATLTMMTTTVTMTNVQRHLQGQERQGDPDQGGPDKVHHVPEGEV